MTGVNVNVSRSQLLNLRVSHDVNTDSGMKLDVYVHNSSIGSFLASQVRLLISDVDIRNMTNRSEAMFTLRNSNISMFNSLFVDNHAIGQDAPVVLDINKSQVLIRNSHFLASDAVAEFDSSTIEIFGSTFMRNVANGSLFASGSVVTITDSTFTENTGNQGVSLNMQDGTNLTVFNSSFVSNNAITSGPAILGMKHSMIHLINSLFANNNALGNGAVDVQHNSFLYVQSCNFTRNKAQSGSAITIIIDSSAHIVDSHFKFNQAVQGGAIRLEENVQLELNGNVFFRNKVGQWTSMFKDNGFSPALSNSSQFTHQGKHTGTSFKEDYTMFYLNHKRHSKKTKEKPVNRTKDIIGLFDQGQPIGGAVLASTNVKVIIKNTNFTESDGVQAGGVLLLMSNVTAHVISSTFINNKAGNGAVVSAFDRIHVAINSSVFSHNEAGLTGGVLDMTNTSCYVHDSNFTSNSANKDGGVFYIDGNDLIIKHSNFTQNEVFTDTGSVLFLSNSNAKVENSTFNKNKATDGSTFSLYLSQLVAHDSSFYQESHDLMSLSKAELVLIDSLIFGRRESNGKNAKSKNDVSRGSLLTLSDESKVAFHKGNISLIKSDAIIQAKTNSSILVKGTKITENSVQSILVAQSASKIIIEDSTIMNNHATGNGGVVQSAATNIMISNSTMQKNTVIGHGGAMYCTGGNITVYNCSFLGNSVNGSAGVVYMSGDHNSRLQMVRSFFHKNIAKLDGAVLYSTGSIDIAFDSCNFSANIATSDSSLMLLDNLSLRTSRCLFERPGTETSNLVSIYFERYSKHAPNTTYMTFQTVFKIGNKTLMSNISDDFVKKAKSLGFIFVHNSQSGHYQIKQDESIYASGM